MCRGKHFGYPDCCIKAFYAELNLSPSIPKRTRKLWGTGYIPCERCNALTEQQLIDNINLRRVCPYPFGDIVFA